MTEPPIVPWVRLLLDELGQAPSTLRRARLVLVELSRLPEQLDALIATLDRLHHDLTSFTAGTEDRIDHLDSVVSELTGALTAIIGAIPGARRALSRVPPPPPPAGP